MPDRSLCFLFLSQRLLLPLIIISFSNVSLVFSKNCYFKSNHTVFTAPDYYTQCPNSSDNSSTQNCCAVLPNHACLTDSLCYDPGPHQYYLSPCTDNTYNAPECPQRCAKCTFIWIHQHNYSRLSSLRFTTIFDKALTFKGNRTNRNEIKAVYDYESQIWRCCSTDLDGRDNCNHPTEETFVAPAPSDLSTTYPLDRTTSKLTSSSPSKSGPALANPSTQSIIISATTDGQHSISTLSASDSAGTSSTKAPEAGSDSSDAHNAHKGGLTNESIIALAVGIPVVQLSVISLVLAYIWRNNSRDRK